MSHTCVFEWHKRFKYGQEEGAGGSRSGRTSTIRTDVNGGRVGQVVRGDHQLTSNNRMSAGRVQSEFDPQLVPHPKCSTIYDN